MCVYVMEFKEDMMKTFEMTDLGLMSYFLGIEVSEKKEDKKRKSHNYFNRIK